MSKFKLRLNPNYKVPSTSYWVNLFIKYKVTKVAFYFKPLYKLLVKISVNNNYPLIKVRSIELTDRHDIVIINGNKCWFTLYDKSYHLGIIE